MDLGTVHESLVNGQLTQAVEQFEVYAAQEYGIVASFTDYRDWLAGYYPFVEDEAEAGYNPYEDINERYKWFYSLAYHYVASLN